MSADTRLGQRRPVMEAIEARVVTPEAVMARVNVLLRGANILRNGLYTPDEIRRIVVRTSKAEREIFSGVVPVLHDFEAHRHLRTSEDSEKSGLVRVAAATVNGVTLARAIVFDPPKTLVDRSTKTVEGETMQVIDDSNEVIAIYQLFGEHQVMDRSKPSAAKVAITVLSFTNGMQKVILPCEYNNGVRNMLISGQAQINIARRMGVAV